MTEVTASSIGVHRDHQEPVHVGVIGVGSMGQNHARVYRQLTDAQLVGVVDADAERATNVASDNGTEVLSTDELLDAADAVSVAVPTEAHEAVVSRCIDTGVDVLVEKPFVPDVPTGRRLAHRAEQAGITLQVGHIERFNPAVQAMFDIVDPSAVIATSARRVGPPVERSTTDGVIMDLMVHDLDVVRAMMGSMPVDIDACASRDGQYATAILTFPNDAVCSFTASRVTQRRCRDIEITMQTSQVEVDYLDQSVLVHRRSHPEYTREAGNLRYRNERIVERPMVERGEPLKRELASFVDAVRTGEPPLVTAEDGIAAIELADRVVEATTVRTMTEVRP